MTTRESTKNRYCIELGGWVPMQGGDLTFEQVAEAGPYKTRIGARIALSRRMGRMLKNLPNREWVGQFDGLPDTQILGATITRFTDENGTQEGWDYDARLNMVEHWQNY